MLVLCSSISGKDLPTNVRIMGETDETQFTPLEIGVPYKVYGIMFYPNRADLLISPENIDPLWVPSNLFEVLDDTLPDDWGCTITEKKIGYMELHEAFGINAICGYVELVRSYKHYTGILEGDPEELNKFYMYKSNH